MEARSHTHLAIIVRSTYIDRRNLFADVMVYTGSQTPPLEVKHNNFSGRPLGWDWNYDASALEVIDQNGHVRFQLIYVTKYYIRIHGIFPTPAGLMLANEDGFIQNAFGIPPGFQIKPLFKYPAYRFQGFRRPIEAAVPQPQLKERTVSLSDELDRFLQERMRVETTPTESDIKTLPRIAPPRGFGPDVLFREQTRQLYGATFAVKISRIVAELDVAGLNVGNLPSICRTPINILVMKDVLQQLRGLSEQMP